MRPVDPPPPGPPPLARSFAACLAAILEVDGDAVPAPPGEDAWTRWRTWLATRGVGLVEISAPATFGWPGPWIALLAGDSADERVAVVAFGSPPGIVWRPLGGDAPWDDVVAGFAVAPHDVALWAPRAADSSPPSVGTVALVALAEHAGGPMRVVGRATAVAGRGLEGDRYARAAGTFSDPASDGHDLTLVEAEAIDALALPGGRALRPEDARRNVVTRGIDLDALVGRRFRVGDVECVGRRLCEPCAHLERLTGPGVLRALVHRGGLRADVVTGGQIEVGADIRPLDG